MRTRTALLGLVLICGLCVGCAPRGVTAPIEEGNPTPPVPSAAVSILAQATQCPAGSTDSAITQLAADGVPSQSGRALSADFDAVAVVRCTDEDETIAGDGVWDVALAQRATTDLSVLTAALRTPSSNPPSGSDIACAGVGVLLPNFALVNAQGQIVRPSLPHDECDEPLTEALNAVNAMPWKTETEQRLNQVQTQAEIDTGCLSAYKDVFDLPSPKATPWTELTEPTTACEYAVSSTSGGVGIGAFVRGVTLDGAQRLAISTALTSAASTPAKACSAQASTFALLMVSPSENVVVELDGCLRMSYPDYFVTQAPTSVLAALRSAGL
jgi:hypothetical protein